MDGSNQITRRRASPTTPIPMEKRCQPVRRPMLLRAFALYSAIMPAICFSSAIGSFFNCSSSAFQDFFSSSNSILFLLVHFSKFVFDPADFGSDVCYRQAGDFSNFLVAFFFQIKQNNRLLQRAQTVNHPVELL